MKFHLRLTAIRRGWRVGPKFPRQYLVIGNILIMYESQEMFYSVTVVIKG